MWLVASLVIALLAATQRVASLNLTADEILVEILPLERLIAATVWADGDSSNIVGRVPPAVTRFRRPDLEKLVALAPDLVVVSEHTDADFQAILTRSGMRVHRLEGLSTLSGIGDAILKLGEAVGEREAARRLAERYRRSLSELGRRLAGAPRPRVLYWSGSFTAGGKSTIGALIEGAGGINVGRELGLEGVGPPGAERVFLADPDVILAGRSQQVASALNSHPLLSRLRAVRERRIVEMPVPLLVTLSHHLAEACWWLAAALHPERIGTSRP
jgi:iron complex transport system substrate-binding protein